MESSFQDLILNYLPSEDFEAFDRVYWELTLPDAEALSPETVKAYFDMLLTALEKAYEEKEASYHEGYSDGYETGNDYSSRY